MLRIAICDDEQAFRHGAESMLKLYMADKDVPFEADTFAVPSMLSDATENVYSGCADIQPGSPLRQLWCAI